MRMLSVSDCGPSVGSNTSISSNEPLSHSLNCLKMVRGRLNLVEGSNIYECRVDFLTGKRTRGDISARSFVKLIFGAEIKFDEGLSLIKAYRNVNVSYYRKLETELSHCLFNYLKGNYLHSFLHFYRSIEKLSASFPLTYISAKNDFEKSVDDLRKFFNDEKGELAFSAKFSEFLSESRTELKTLTIDFNTKYKNVDDFDKLSNEITSCCPGFIEDTLDTSNGTFSVSFNRVVPFVIECRNRLFHFSKSGQRNFDIDRMGGPNELCRMLVEGGMNWVTISLDEIWRRQVSRIVFV